MKEKPKSFSTPMIRAILNGSKTQFRLVGKLCPYRVGDRLWCKETCWYPAEFDHSVVYYKADWDNDKPAEMFNHNGIWQPSTNMPRWASRLTLEVTEVRAQRVQATSHEDAIAEGAEYMPPATLREQRLSVPQIVFAGYWDSTYAKRGYPWESNPWTFPITFKVVKEAVL